PYHYADVCRSILTAKTPLLPKAGPERDRAYVALYRQRTAGLSYVGARLLIDLAEHHAVSGETREELSVQY
ncbi:hypothetical protein, partial [Streptococcus pneumoniae]|uniref:hypothetical protein n=1 Tax=Streptococcus pneumoniae TaxID=1313 RepID=UPI001953B4AF